MRSYVILLLATVLLAIAHSLCQGATINNLVATDTDVAAAATCSNCPQGNLCCNDLNNNQERPTCYNPSTHQCNNGNRICPLNHLSCGKACYMPSAYQCNSGDRLCPLGYQSCGESCYSPFQFACSNGQLVNHCVPGVCQNLACCPSNGICYNPNHFQCTNEGLFIKCFGIPSNDPSVCMGHGTCDGLNHCVCTGGWSGNSCYIPPPSPQ